MSIGLIVGGTLVVLGVLLFLAWQIPDVIEKAQKKNKRAPAALPPKDWQPIAERFEKRVKIMEEAAQSFEAQLRGKDKQAEQVNTTLALVRKQLEQEKAWREKEEAELQKEKKQERTLQEELLKTRQALNTESTEKIKLEHELTDIRREREQLSGTGRGLSSRVLELDRQLESALKELKQLREQNYELSRKREDTEWVAKSDYRQLESALKRARFEGEEFKKAFPPSEWPASLRPDQDRKAEK
ncbi:MAG: hypothetical protein WCO69_01880 [Candidatus Omnitrophota bacterium]